MDGQKVLRSDKPSGSFFLVRLLAPWKEHDPGEEVVVDEALADLLSSRGIAAVQFERPQSIWVPV